MGVAWGGPELVQTAPAECTAREARLNTEPGRADITREAQFHFSWTVSQAELFPTQPTPRMKRQVEQAS